MDHVPRLSSRSLVLSISHHHPYNQEPAVLLIYPLCSGSLASPLSVPPVVLPNVQGTLPSSLSALDQGSLVSSTKDSYKDPRLHED
jgi:hypothetical protein